MENAYLFALNLFALTALFLGLNNFSKGASSWRLIPLFGLVAARAVIIIVTQYAPQSRLVPTLEVFSTLCVVWALLNPLGRLSPQQRGLIWMSGGAALMLCLLVLFPDWPVPVPLHSLTIAILSTPIITLALGRISWWHLSVPMTLALGYFLLLLEMPLMGELVVVLAYALLIAVLHREEVQFFEGRRDQSEAAAQRAISLSRERQRLVEVSEIISAVPSIEASMAHVARSMAHITQADQAAMFVLDLEFPDMFHLAAVYSPERPVDLDGFSDHMFNLDDFVLLAEAVETQQQLLITPPKDEDEVSALYMLWYDERTGPTVLQPLGVQGRPVGAMLLGNPVTFRQFRQPDLTLCRSLSAQIATMADSFRRYIDLNRRIESVVEEADRRGPEPGGEFMSLPVLEPVAAAEMETLLSREPALKSEPAGWLRPLPQTRSRDESLVAPELQHAQFLEVVSEGVIVSDAGGRVQLVNRAAERILGKARHELLGQSIGMIYDEIDSMAPIEDLAAVLSRRDTPLPTFYETKDRVIQGQLVPWRSEEQEWLGIIAVFREVTAQVRADQVQAEFIKSLSRQLRAPLTTIKGYSELIIRGDMEAYSPGQIYIQQLMHSSADRMTAILDNAIQLGVQTRDSSVPRFEEVDVRALIGEALKQISALARLQKVSVASEVATNLPLLWADRRQLLRIILNLLENACHFTPPGGNVRVQASLRGGRSGNRFRPEITIAVKDNGIGIPKSEQARIFEPFYQIPGETGSGGMGMGLAVVKQLVALHNGRVWVESVEQEGAVFQVALPVKPA